jgi:hypothetical protein
MTKTVDIKWLGLYRPPANVTASLQKEALHTTQLDTIREHAREITHGDNVEYVHLIPLCLMSVGASAHLWFFCSPIVLH